MNPAAIDLGPTAPLAPPLYSSSVYHLPSLEALEAVSAGTPGFLYARDAHPNAVQLEAALAAIEGAAAAVVCANGMSALTVPIVTLVGAGERIVASDQLYGRTKQLLVHELRRFGVSCDFVDSNDLEAVAWALTRPGRPPAKLFLAETISNPLLRVADIPGLTELAHRQGVSVFLDNTFATPVVCQPLSLGADLVMESLTKFIGGHSDITLGVVATNDSRLLPRLRQVRSIWGWIGNPFDCWLALRSLPTLELRLAVAQRNAAALADWLAEQPGLTDVFYPSHASHPDVALARRLLRGGGHMLAVNLAGGRSAVERFIRQAPALPFAPSLGDVRTTCSYPAGTSHRSLDPAEQARLGIGPGLLRVSVGIEPFDDLQAAFRAGLTPADE